MDTQSSAPKWLVLGGVVVGLASAVALFVGHARSPEYPVEDMGEQVASRASESPQDGRRTPSKASGSLPGEQGPPLLARPALTPGELIEQVLQEDKKLGLFMHYHKTVLLDEKGRDEYRKLLADPELMTAMANDLMDPGKGEVEPKEQYHRLMQIDYLEAALNWKDNPQRQKVLALTGNVILKDNFSSDQNMDRRQMLAGGKMELYRLMYEQDVSKALDLVVQAQGTRMERLIFWMGEENLRRRAREEQIRTEMQEQQANAK